MTRCQPLQRGRVLLALLLLLASCALLSRAAAFPDWTDCPAVCSCRWTSGKKSALCPDAGLTSLPASLDPDMQVLDLSGNRIPSLQAEIFKLAGLLNLQRVFLRGAGVCEVHGDAFRDMRILVEVDLSDNHLSSLESHTFAGNERLKLLALSGNPLRSLGPSQFPTLQHLRTLELRRCSIGQVHPTAFQRLPALETLGLDNNELEYLAAETITGLKRLKTLGLDNNPWSCDCRLRDFGRLLTSGALSRLYSVPQSCARPARLQGKRWEELKQQDFACEPSVRLPVSSIQEEMNGNVSLACLASGDPEPEVWWQLNGGPVNGSRRSAADEVGTPGGLVTYSTSLETRRRLVERWSNLTIYNASDADAGEYTCHARNVAGQASDTVAVSVPRVFSAPTLSQADSWLLWLSLAGGGTVALCVSASAVLLAVCVCGGARRRSRRAKVKLQASASFGDQEKKLLDLSVTTTATTASREQNSQQNHSHQPTTQQQAVPVEADLNHCQADFELELEHPAQERLPLGQQAAPASVTVERLRLQHQPELSPVGGSPAARLCPLALSSGRGGPCSPASPAALPANVFVSVSLASCGSPDRPSPRRASLALAAQQQAPQPALEPPGPEPPEQQGPRERCYPDLLDIGLSSFATLPRRSLGRSRELGSPYDNMGPRVTATGSSTFSLAEQPEPGGAGPPAPLIRPPPEFVSL